MKARPTFEPHLLIHEITLPRGGEWTPSFGGWALVQINSGISYWRHAEGTRELPAGSCLVLAGGTSGVLLASQLNEVVINHVCLRPDRLAGLLSLPEQESLARAVASQKNLVRMLPAADTISERFKTLCRRPDESSLPTRLQLLQLFADLWRDHLSDHRPVPELAKDGSDRLRQLLGRITASEFVELSLSDLAPRIGCSPRHLSRLFHQEVGVSFREKQTELRLAKACELLASSKARVVEVALSSGYRSNSLFSLSFKKRFGLSPLEWRQRNEGKGLGRQKLSRLLSL